MNKSYRYLGFLLLGFCCLVFADNDSDSNKNFSTSSISPKTFVIMIQPESSQNSKNFKPDQFFVVNTISTAKNENLVLVDTKEVTSEAIASSYDNYQSSRLFCIDASSWAKLNLENHSTSEREGHRAFILHANNKSGSSDESGRFLGFPPFPLPSPIFDSNFRKSVNLDAISSDSQNQSLVGYDGLNYRMISVEEYKRLKDSAWQYSEYFSNKEPLTFKSVTDSPTDQDMDEIGFNNFTITECKDIESVRGKISQDIQDKPQTEHGGAR